MDKYQHKRDWDIEVIDRPASTHKRTSAKKKSKTKWIVLLSFIGVLVLFRIFLPYILLNYVNKKLSELTEYTGDVKDIDVALLRGAYVIKELRIMKVDRSRGKTQSSDTLPFFKTPLIDLSVEWSSVFKGAFVGEVYVEEPVLNYVKGTHKHEDVKADTADFRKIMRNLMPLTVNHFEISRGQIHYIDNSTRPYIDIAMKDVEAVATNLSNVNDSAKLLPAHLEAHGNVYNGQFKMSMDFDAMNPVPTFDMNAEMKGMDLVKVNNFFKAYGNFEIEKGNFGLYTEMAAKEGSYGGYVKPVIKEIKVKQGEGNIKDVVWELIVGGATKILTNPAKHQVATKVDIKGKFDSSTEINTWRAVTFILRNAFVRGLKPSVDNTINIHQIEEKEKKTLLEKIFGTGKKKKK